MKEILIALISAGSVLLGVILGNYLGESSMRKREQEKIASLKNIINKEFETILGQMSQKKDIVQQK